MPSVAHRTLQSDHMKRHSDLASLLLRIFAVSPIAPRGKPASVPWLTSFCLSLQPHFPALLAPALLKSQNPEPLASHLWTHSSLTFLVDERPLVLQISLVFVSSGEAGWEALPTTRPAISPLKLLLQSLLVTYFPTRPLG